MVRRVLKLGMPTLARFQYQQKAPDVQLEEIIHSFLRSHHYVLDAGCGTASRAAAKGSCRMVVGVDCDRRIIGNPGVDSFVLACLDSLPFRDKTFDLIMSWMVVEHLNNPHQVFAEFSRVSKPGALVVLATPNLRHYATRITSLAPFCFQRWFLRYVLRGQCECFPTRYRANTPKKLAMMMESQGFTTAEVRCIDDGPAYLDWMTLAYAAALIYHRLVSHLGIFSYFRRVLIGVFQR